LRRFLLTIEYDGTDFSGWQLQPNARSVQGVIEAAFKEVAQEEVRVNAAGRTDAGVHARGQMAHVDSGTRLTPLELRKALNAELPPDVAVREVWSVPAGFNARRDVQSKRYVYRILNAGQPGPLRRRQTWHLRRPLDLSAMREAAGSLLGTHDFAAFRGAPGGSDPDEGSLRSIDRLDVLSSPPEVQIVVEGRSFLRYMVRNVVGTLVEVGQGRRTAAEVGQILAARDRALAGPTAPAHGLCLDSIRYREMRRGAP
jgi:tRNA pseudouridine38-40 synthase